MVLSLPAPWELQIPLSANTPSWGQRRGLCLWQDLAPVGRQLGVAGTVAAGGRRRRRPRLLPRAPQAPLCAVTLLETGCPRGPFPFTEGSSALGTLAPRVFGVRGSGKDTSW